MEMGTGVGRLANLTVAGAAQVVLKLAGLGNSVGYGVAGIAFLVVQFRGDTQRQGALFQQKQFFSIRISAEQASQHTFVLTRSVQGGQSPQNRSSH